VWVESGGYIAARYVGAYPFDNVPTSNWQRSTLWKHKLWFVNWHDDEKSVISFWAAHMSERIATVLGFKNYYGNLEVVWPKILLSVKDVIFVIKADCIR
jgi:hypothetical protein